MKYHLTKFAKLRTNKVKAVKHTYKILLQRSADDLYIPLWCITILGKHMDISSSTELLYVSKVGSLFTNQRASKFGWEREVNFHLHLKYHSKQVQSSFTERLLNLRQPRQ